ncbi:hypothetical protein OHV05_35920 (plasmid) [Kitasatospora sp. NBC_00070]|uniref:hypothetical protein n=1 Tax=Kitasatospora sp. NBC_00070 TaxID=2975962 RepID=UPI002F91181A
MEIPEKRQAEALKEVARLGAERAAALSEVDRVTAELRKASVAAAELGASRSRVRELGGIAATTLYGWFETAGIEVQARRPRKQPRSAWGLDRTAGDRPTHPSL